MLPHWVLSFPGSPHSSSPSSQHLGHSKPNPTPSHSATEGILHVILRAHGSLWGRELQLSILVVTCSAPSTPGLRPSLPPSPSPDIFHRCLHSLKMWFTVLTSSWALCDSSTHSEDPPTLSSSRPSCHGAFLGVSATPECITTSQVTTTEKKSSQTRRIQSLMLRLGHSSLPEQASQEGCSTTVPVLHVV